MKSREALNITVNCQVPIHRLFHILLLIQRSQPHMKLQRGPKQCIHTVLPFSTVALACLLDQQLCYMLSEHFNFLHLQKTLRRNLFFPPIKIKTITRKIVKSEILTKKFWSESIPVLENCGLKGLNWCITTYLKQVLYTDMNEVFV